MPSTPAETSPFPESQLKREGVPGNLPGGPSTAGKAGGVQAGRFSYPNPPSPNSAAPGRPPTSTGPVPGVATPSPPTAAAPAAPGAGSSQSQQAPEGTVAGQEQVPAEAKAALGAEQVTDPNAVDQGGMQSGQPIINMSRMPRAGETPPGAIVQTPFGTVEQDDQGSNKLTLSPEGKARYKEAKASLRKKLGAMPESLSGPGMPEMPIELGQYNYNPFTGRMERG